MLEETKKTKRPTHKPKPSKSASTMSVGSLSSPRRVQLPKYRPISLRKRIKPVRATLPSAFRLFYRSVGILKRHWRLFLGILLIYIVLNIILVRGLSSAGTLSNTKAVLNGIFKGPSGKLTLGFALFISLLTGSSSPSVNASAGAYQAIIVIVVSLAVIWALRKIYSNEQVRIRDTFYLGMYPFVLFILVLLVIGLQLLPLVIGGTLFSLVSSNGIAVHVIEKVIWGGLFFVLALLSLYMVCSSLFALYIVTLPDMTPMKALRSARELVRYRRLIVMRKIVFLPFILLILGAAIIMPISLTITPAAEWVFFVLSLLSLIVIHSYMYALYRELLR